MMGTLLIFNIKSLVTSIIPELFWFMKNFTFDRVGHSIGPKMGISINNMKIIHTSTFTIIYTNFNHYLETTQRNQREIIIRRRESVSHKEDTIYEYIYYIKKSLKIIIVFFTLNNLLFFS